MKPPFATEPWFVVLYNGNYSDLARVAILSVNRFSRYRCLGVNLEHEEEDLIGFECRRLRWLRDNLSTYQAGLCLLDADMVATLFVDQIWRFPLPDYFPLFETHATQTGRESEIAGVPDGSDFVYLHFVPSLWPWGAGWFAQLCLNTMILEKVVDEVALVRLWWRAGLPYRIPVQSTNPLNGVAVNSWCFFHGEKDATKAKKLLDSL